MVFKKQKKQKQNKGRFFRKTKKINENKKIKPKLISVKTRAKTEKKIRQKNKNKKRVKRLFNKAISKKAGKAKKSVKMRKPKVVKSSAFEGPLHKPKIRIIGIGGGGSSIISEIASKIKKVDFIAANTDVRALRELPRYVKRFQFGQNVTKGLGTGMSVELGEAAAQQDKERIEKLLENQDLCVIVVSLGGGTGAGAVPVFAKILKNLGSITYGIFTIPFEFEGEKKKEIALTSLEKIKSHLNAYSIIPNERIFQIIDKDTPLKDALSAINKRLAENLEGLIEMIYFPGLINIDFADLRTIFEGRGRLSYLNTIEIDGPDRQESVKRVISSPLYFYTIKGAKGILYNINGGRGLQLSEVSELSKTISESVNKTAKIIFGVNPNKKYQNKIKITLLATGCTLKAPFIKAKKNKSFLKTKFPALNQKKFLKKKKEANKPSEKKENKSIKKTAGKSKPTKIKKIKKSPKQNPVLKQNKNKIEKKENKKFLETDKIEKKKEELSVSQPSGPAENNGDRQIPKNYFTNVTKDNFPSNGFNENNGADSKIRRNALQVKKVIEEEEKELLEKEKIWDTPAILRKNKK